MLVRIAADSVQVGMFIHAFEGSWFDHPFWRARFVIDRAEDVAKLRESKVETVLIDDSKGIAPACEEHIAPTPQPVAEASPQNSPAQPEPVERRRSPRRARLAHGPDKPSSTADEIERAAQVVDRSKLAIRDMLADIRLGKAVDGGALVPLVNDISASINRNPYALIGITRLKTADEYTYMHSVAVCALMINLARHLGLPEKLIRDIGMAGLLHDVGKMAVPTEVLNKPGTLTDDEQRIVRNHPERGHRLLARSGGVCDIALDVCLHHHERIDGTGYPHGLRGGEISLHARMGAVCDVYDAVTSARSYKPAWHPTEALSRMAGWEGHFDPRVFDALVRSVGIYPVGSVVRLRSNKLALVVEEGTEDLTRPLLRTFYSLTERCRIGGELIRLDGISDRIVGPDDPAIWQIRDWPALKLELLAEVPRRAAA